MSTTNNDLVHNFLGHALRSARKGLRLSQEEFAKPIGLTGGYISKLEKGERLPSELVVRGIVNTHQIRREWLEGKTDLVGKPIEPYQSQNKKAERSPVVETILGVTDQLSTEGQSEALKAVMEIFISEQTKGKL